MTGAQRRQQLLDVGRALFADKGFEATSVEEIATRAQVSKPVVYEHFGGKEGLYAVVVDREVSALLGVIMGALVDDPPPDPRLLLERAVLALLDYVESNTDGFRILVRDSPVAQATGTFASLIGDVATQVEHLLSDEFSRLMREMQIGMGRSDALRAMGERTNVPEVRTFVGAMVQADQFGIPVAQVLRVQSAEMRVKRRQRAEEKAQQVPVKITVPLIFCILPCLFIAVMGPAVISIMDNFK